MRFNAGAGVAQAKKPLPIVGVLTLGSGSTGSGGIPAFREELGTRGWKDGSQVAIEALNAEGAYDRLPILAEALARKNPAVIAASTSRAVAAAAKAAPRTPVVMVVVSDPVAFGFAVSLARPGGMLTGTSNASAETVVKFTEMLVTAKAGLRRIGFLSAVSAESRPGMLDAIRRSAAQYSVEVSIAEVERREEKSGARPHRAPRGHKRPQTVIQSSWLITVASRL